MKQRIKNHPLAKQYGEELLVFSHGEGCRLYDASGKEYLDMGAGIAVNALGYGRRDLAETAYEQMTKLTHVSNLFTTPPQLELAEKIVASHAAAAAVHFGSSGTEANEAALKYARLYALSRKGAGHHRLIAFSSSFHGRTMGSLSLTANRKYTMPFEPLLPGCTILPYNDLQALEDNLDETVAGVIVEPVQGEGGLNQLSREFAEALNRLCRQYDALLIADEVQSGLGRCGALYAGERIGLKPDIITLAKPLGGGLPLSATLLPAKVDALLKPGHHASTFGGGPVTTMVALKVWDIVTAHEFIDEVSRKGEFAVRLLEEGLGERAGEVRGAGLLLGLRLRDTKFDGPWCDRIIAKMNERGIIILKSGTDVLRLAPPLVISDDELKWGIAQMLEVIRKDIEG
ncbi:MAG: hypothetical protein B6D68_03325 [spirochete symbiont of Stewartia floridana]|nr:MAG: hypothetical protein B6D68_03325 [spirochete symbiont of Stewartia floridana]